MTDFLGFAQAMDSNMTGLQVGRRVRLLGAEFKGADATLLALRDDGKATCIIDGGNGPVHVAFHAIEHRRFDGFDVTDDLGRVFPSLKDTLAGGAPARLERSICTFHKPPVKLSCKPGKLPDGTPRSDAHRLGATLDVANSHLTLTLWTVLDGRILASRVAAVERVASESDQERLVVAASMINMFENGWWPDSPDWVTRWVTEGESSGASDA